MSWFSKIDPLGAAIIKFLFPGPPKQAVMQPQAIQPPTVERGTPIAVFFGTCDVVQPFCGWYGDISSKAIKKKGGKK